MKVSEMSLNTRLEVALEILSARIANESKKGTKVESEEMQLLIKERNLLYSGNEEILNKIIDVYGKEIKELYEGVNE